MSDTNGQAKTGNDREGQIWADKGRYRQRMTGKVKQEERMALKGREWH